MKLHPFHILRLRRKLSVAVLAGAAATSVGLTAAPAEAANLNAPSMTVTLLPANAATVQVCFAETADPIDVVAGIPYIERVHVWGRDPGPDTRLDRIGPGRLRVFPDLLPRSVCRTKNYVNRAVLNEDPFGTDELYARIVLDPVPAGLPNVVVRTGVVSVNI